MAKAKSAKPAYEQIKVRVRGDTRKQLEQAAKASGLTLNAELVQRLERSFTVEEELQRERQICTGLLARDARLGRQVANYLEALLREREVDEETRSYVTSSVAAYFAKDKSGEKS